MNQQLPSVCVVYVTRSAADGNPQILLGRKKTGIGVGRLVAPGGKVEVGETVRQAAVREVNEEVALKLVENSLSHVGDLTYLFPTKPAWNQRSSVFLASHPGGDPVESDELAPEWFPVEALPLEEMWDDASYWLRRALGGTFVTATFVFNPDLKTVASTDYRER